MSTCLARLVMDVSPYVGSDVKRFIPRFSMPEFPLFISFFVLVVGVGTLWDWIQANSLGPGFIESRTINCG